MLVWSSKRPTLAVSTLTRPLQLLSAFPVVQGFVPESMFDRLLTGPVVRGEGASRRGRRPKSEIARAAAAAAAVASTSGINPLLVNSLFAGMDLTSLQNLQNLQSLQLAGLMGFPPGLATAATAGGDAKSPAAVLPLFALSFQCLRPSSTA